MTDQSRAKVRDDGNPAKYYAQVPHVIWTLGLSIYAVGLYCYLKRVCGEDPNDPDQACWQSTETIAKGMGISTGSVSNAKRELLEAMIGDKPLIILETVPSVGAHKPSHWITLTDIWAENIAHCQQLRAQKKERQRQMRAALEGL